MTKEQKKKIRQARAIILTLKLSCQEALSDEWDRSDEGFQAMEADCEIAQNLLLEVLK